MFPLKKWRPSLHPDSTNNQPITKSELRSQHTQAEERRPRWRWESHGHGSPDFHRQRRWIYWPSARRTTATLQMPASASPFLRSLPRPKRWLMGQYIDRLCDLKTFPQFRRKQERGLSPIRSTWPVIDAPRTSSCRCVWRRAASWDNSRSAVKPGRAFLMDNWRRRGQGQKELDMNLHARFRNESALTLLEVIVVVGILAVLVLMILGTYAGPASRLKAQKIRCTSNLKQLGMSYRVWEGDHLDSYPMSVSLTNGGSMELAQTGNVVLTYLIMSNEISAPQILWCPADTAHQKCETFARLSISNISYFVNVDASEANPQEVLTGDSNLEINGQPVK